MTRNQFVRHLSADQPFTLVLPDGTRLRAVERLIRGRQVSTRRHSRRAWPCSWSPGRSRR